jgi:rSAM/selenodomain-associated transferase 1
MEIKPKSNACALAVMTKAPVAGISKTRLVPPLSATEAAALSACFLRDTCDNIARISSEGTVDGIAVYTPAGSEAFLDGLLPESFVLVSQRGEPFGDRLFHATEDLSALGYDSLCLIDSDSPTLPPRFLRAAVSALARPGDRVVLGAAKDGGYYLIGLKQVHRRVFENVDWSTSRVLAQTIARAKELHLPVTILPAWFDVDDAASLQQLCNELFVENEMSSAGAYHAPHTRRFLSRLIEADGGRQRIWRPITGFNREIPARSWTCDLTTE